MIATTHPVSPEEVMALADGELSTAQASAVAAHIAECPECASLAAQFAATSTAFSKWTVPATPASLDTSVATLSADAGVGKQASTPTRAAFRDSRWTVARLTPTALAACSRFSRCATTEQSFRNFSRIRRLG